MGERLKRLWSKRWVRALLIALVVAIPAASYGGHRGVTYIKTDPQFCSSCHLMQDAFDTWRHGAHKDVICQSCHRAGLFEEMQLGYAAFVERPEEIGPHTKLDVRICRECHVSDNEQWRQIARTPGHRTHAVEREIGCLECHVRRLHAFEADAAQCERCHGKEHLRLKGMSELHCLGCHDYVGRLHPDSTTEIPTAQDCRRCHAPAEGEAPPVVAAGHPEHAGKAAPVQKGHDNCLGCHRPHGAPLDVPIDCLRCHRALLEGGKHLEDERLSECLECHEPHER